MTSHLSHSLDPLLNHRVGQRVTVGDANVRTHSARTRPVDTVRASRLKGPSHGTVS